MTAPVPQPVRFGVVMGATLADGVTLPDDDPTWGLAGGLFCWITGNTQLNTISTYAAPLGSNLTAFMTGILTPDFWKGFGFSGDMKTVGGYCGMKAAFLEVLNDLDLPAYLLEYGISISRKPVWFYVITWNGSGWDFKQWHFDKTDGFEHGDGTCRIPLIDCFKDVHGKIPQSLWTLLEFPFQAVDDKGKPANTGPIPICFGYVKNAELINMGTPVGDDGVTGKQLVYDSGAILFFCTANLITGNSTTVKINGVTIGPVVWAGGITSTMNAIVAAILASSMGGLFSSIALQGSNSFWLYTVMGSPDITISAITTGGASQPIWSVAIDRAKSYATTIPIASIAGVAGGTQPSPPLAYNYDYEYSQLRKGSEPFSGTFALPFICGNGIQAAPNWVGKYLVMVAGKTRLTEIDMASLANNSVRKITGVRLVAISSTLVSYKAVLWVQFDSPFLSDAGLNSNGDNLDGGAPVQPYNEIDLGDYIQVNRDAAWWFQVWDFSQVRVVSEAPINSFLTQPDGPIAMSEQSVQVGLISEQKILSNAGIRVKPNGFAPFGIPGCNKRAGAQFDTGDPSQTNGLKTPINTFIPAGLVQMVANSFTCTGVTFTVGGSLNGLGTDTPLPALSDGSPITYEHLLFTGNSASYQAHASLSFRIGLPKVNIVSSSQRFYLVFKAAIFSNNNSGVDGAMTNQVRITAINALTTGPLSNPAEVTVLQPKAGAAGASGNYPINVNCIPDEYFNGAKVSFGVPRIANSDTNSDKSKLLDVTEFVVNAKGNAGQFILQYDLMSFASVTGTTLDLRFYEIAFLSTLDYQDLPDRIFADVVGENYMAETAGGPASPWYGRNLTGRTALAALPGGLPTPDDYNPVRGVVDFIEHIMRAKDKMDPALIDWLSFDFCNAQRPAFGPAPWVAGGQWMQYSDSSFDLLDLLAKHLQTILAVRHDGRRALIPWYTGLSGDLSGYRLLVGSDPSLPSDFIEGTLGDAVETDPSLLYTEYEFTYANNPITGENSVLGVYRTDEATFPPENGILSSTYLLTGQAAAYLPNLGSPFIGFVVSSFYTANLKVGMWMQLQNGFGPVTPWGAGYRQITSIAITDSTGNGIIQFARIAGDPTTAVSLTSTWFSFRVDVLADWTDYVKGVDDYSTAATLWQTGRNTFLLTGRKNRLSLDLPFFQDTDALASSIPSMAGLKPAPYYLALILMDYCGKPKKLTPGNLRMTPANLALEYGDTVLFKDSNNTSGKRYYAFIHNLELQEVNGTPSIAVELLWIPWKNIDTVEEMDFEEDGAVMDFEETNLPIIFEGG